MLKSRYFKPQLMSSNLASPFSLLPRLDTGTESAVGERRVLPRKCELARAAPSISKPVTRMRLFVREQRDAWRSEGCAALIT